MSTFNPSDDVLRKLVAGSRAVPDISNDDIEAALADATTKNTLKACEKMGLAPSDSCENGQSMPQCEVPVPIFSQPLSDEQVSRVLGKVHRLIAASTEVNIPGERTVSAGRFAASSDANSPTACEPGLVIIPASPASQRPVSRTAIAAFTASLLSLICVCLLTSRELPRRVSEGERIQKSLSTVLRYQAGKYRLTAKPAPDVVEPAKVAVGDTIETHDFERRRLALPDDSILYVNANSSVTVLSSRSIDVTRGAIFVEVAQKPDAAKFEVITPNRTVTSLGTKFAVNVDEAETAVTVTQGRVLVSGINAPIIAGQKLVVLQDEVSSPASGGRQSPDQPAVASSGDSRPPLDLQRKEYILTSLPSAASELEWTRDLIAAATGPLVPKSEYAGGALVTVDPNGQSSQFSLRKYHVDVHIEDGFARTTIDQTYFNHTHSRLEGTFHFPLPPDASLSRLAMYVNGKLMEGGMAERDHARNTFEEIKRKMLDPALLEWVDGSTFKMRVFPLEPRQEKRIILSYSQRLPSVDGQMTYRFPAGHTMDVVREWSAAVRIKGGDGSTWSSPSHDLKPVESTAREDAGDLLLEASEKNARLDRDLVLTSQASGRASALRADSPTNPSTSTVPSPPRSGEKVADRPDEGADARSKTSADETDKTKSQSPLTLSLSPDGERGQSSSSVAQISNFKSESHNYLMLRLRPDLTGDMQRKPHHWIFLFEHSGDRSPLLARTQIEILRTLLNNAEHSDTFSIVKASTRATLYSEQPLECSPENIAAAVKHLENVHLVGAMDLAAALTAIESQKRKAESGKPASSAFAVGFPLSAFRSPFIVHLGSGHTALGVRDAAKLVEFLPKEVPYIGIGVGKRWNQSLMNLAASRTGGLSVQINPDEDVAWRAFEVFSKLHSPRLVNVKVKAESGKPKAGSGNTEESGSEISNLKSEMPEAHFHLFSDTISQGEEIAAICRIPDGQPLPTEIIVTATLNGQPWSQTVAVENINEQASYLPRHWAKLEIDRLLAENAAGNREAIVALSKSMYVMSPFTSLLVLENDEMYTQFNVDRGRKDHWAMYACPDQIPVVVEDGDAVVLTGSGSNGESAASEARQKDVFSTIVRIPAWSWPTPSSTQSYVHRFGWYPMNGPRSGPMGWAANNLWFDPNARDDFSLPSNAIELYSKTPANWEYLPNLNGWGSDGTNVWMLDVDNDGDGIRSGVWIEPRFDSLAIPEPPTSAPITDFKSTLRQDFFYRIPRFDSPPETLSYLFSDAPVVFEQQIGYFDIDPTKAYIIPQTANLLTARNNISLGRNEWSPFEAQQPISGWDLNGVPIDEPLDNSLAEHEIEAKFSKLAGERSKFKELLAENRRDSRRGYFNNDLNSVELSAMQQRQFALDPRKWNELKRRREQFEFRERKLDTNLSTKISLHAHNAEFQSAIQQLASSSSVRIVIDVQALRRVGISEKQLVNVDVDGITLKSALNLLLDQIGDLTYRITGDVVTIRPTLRREQNGGPGLPSFVNSQTHRWSAAQPGDGASLVSLPVFNSNGPLPAMVNPMIFTDLITHAPGLNTSTADALAVMEAETKISNLKSQISNPSAGRVEDAARGLIEKARGRGWESVTIGGSNNEPGITIHYDGQGRHVWERVISEGLREQVVCDGSTLWHVYREIGLAAKRPFSRFHHEDFSHLVPWLLPSVDELARGADVVAMDERTVAVVPISTVPSPPRSGEKVADRPDEGVDTLTSNSANEADRTKSPLTLALSPESGERGQETRSAEVQVRTGLQPRLHLLFDADGRLIERQWIERSQIDGVETNMTLLRITYSADGVVKVFDRDGKEQMTLNLHRAIAAEPKLVPDLNGLVVLPMPVRTPETILARVQNENAATPDADLSEDDDLSLMLAYMANGNAARMVEIARARFIEKGDTRDGLYVLLSRYPSALVRAAESAPANGTALLGFDLRPSVEGSPLRQYLRQCINWMDEPNPFVNAKDFRIDAPEGSFLERMATARNWYVRWSSGNATKDLTQAQVQVDVEQAIAFVATCHSDHIAWMILSAMKPLLSTPEQQAMLAKAMERFESHPQIGRFAQRERIMALFAAGQQEEARQLFAEWFRDHLDSGTTPVIGEELYKAYVAGPKGNDSFTELITSEAKRLLETQRLMSVNLLAIQISQLGDLPLADRLMTMLIETLNVEQRPDVSLLAIEHLRRFNDPRAAMLLDRMLELPSVSDLPQIWRFAATMAESSGHKRLAIDRLELAIQLEFATRPTTINIETVRADYTALLAKYEELINAAATLETAPPEGLAERIIQAADQWRSLDDDDTAACQTAARLLAKLHQKDTAWDYQITPLAENSGESTPWINLARQLTTDKSFTLADMAWSRAFEFESSNPEILLEHAKMQMESKSKDAAKALLNRIESGSWQPRFQPTVEAAKQMLQSL